MQIEVYHVCFFLC